jgi:hypothetical protein
MSEFFTYICTKSTADPFLPTRTPSLEVLARDTSYGFGALAGGYYRVGELTHFPVQRSVPNHLLCDGREVAKASFPELYAYLGSSQGTATDADKFVLPQFLGSFAPAAASGTETEVGGTVSTPVPTPPGGDPAPDPNIYGDTDSGGRPAASSFAVYSFNSINTATHAAITIDMTVTVGSSGTVELVTSMDVETSPLGGGGVFPVLAIFRWWNGTSWVDVDSEVPSSPDATVSGGTVTAGGVSFNTSKTGLTPSSRAKFRLYARNSSGTRTMTFEGTARARAT